MFEYHTKKGKKSKILPFQFLTAKDVLHIFYVTHEMRNVTYEIYRLRNTRDMLQVK